jgi:membrane associated rhomboid family serine protease
MDKALKVAMTVYGSGGTVFGLFYLFFPRQATAMQGFQADSSYLVATKMALGASLVAVGIFVTIAARDPIKHILWLRFAIVFAILFLVVALYSGFRLFADVGQASVGIIIHGVAAVALLGFYPWRR